MHLGCKGLAAVCKKILKLTHGLAHFIPNNLRQPMKCLDCLQDGLLEIAIQIIGVACIKQVITFRIKCYAMGSGWIDA